MTSRTLNLWTVMNQSITNGITSPESYLPGNLKVRRRAPGLHKRLVAGFITSNLGWQTTLVSALCQLEATKWIGNRWCHLFLLRPSDRNVNIYLHWTTCLCMLLQSTKRMQRVVELLRRRLMVLMSHSRRCRNLTFCIKSIVNLTIVLS